MIEKIDNEITPKILMKNNVLVQAKYNLTLIENRIFLMLLYKLQKISNGVMSCEITHDEFKEIIKKSKDRTVVNIQKILNGLRKKHMYFIKERNNGDILWGKYGFINGFEYDEKARTFRIESSEKINSLIQNYLENGYTPNNLAILFELGNYYAQRLYDLLRLWSGTKSIITYSIDELKMYLNLEGKYKDYNNFKRRVILPAIKTLIETGYFEIDFKENKIGRKVDSIDFIVKDFDKRKYFDTNENNKFYIPDETVFTKGSLRSFKMDFKNIDFKNEYMEKAFNDSVMIAFDRDNVEIIKASLYKFFKGTLDNKIIEYKLEEQDELKHKQEMDM